ncbi:MAG TPA: MIP/aquaporin family protein [Vicinamibacterales bacterium]|jgi:glycerol uptake facilitator|nr:MIP/aquaporin family protein [Vicinamibacterales bacterium]
MSPILAEFLGTALLILFGDGVVANVVLSRSKGQNSGWIVIAAGWACAVTIAVYSVNALSGAHLNPAVTIAAAAIGKFEWSRVPGYVLAQTTGAFLGGVLVWLTYLPHWPLTDDKGAKLAVFCTGPAVRRPLANLVSEAIATAALTLGLLTVLTPKNLIPNSGFESAFAPLLVGIIVFGIGLSLGGSTGYAINPARDLGPRLAHALLPIPGKGTSDWGYAWVPVVGPIIGGVLGALVYVALWGT